MHSSGGLKAEWKTRPTGKACMVSTLSSKPKGTDGYCMQPTNI